MKTKRIAAIALSLAVVVLFSSCMATKDIVRTIQVSGSGEVELTADIASFNVQVSELGKTTKDAQSLANEKMASILKALRSSQIEDKDIKTTSLNLRPSYKWIDNQQVLEGQIASQSLSVIVRDLPALGAVIDKLGEISGISLNSVRLDKEDKSQALDEARQKAVAAALAKAEIYAMSTNMEVGTPITISESSVASTPYEPRAMKMMANESYDMATEIPVGTMTVRSTIHLLLEMY
ncbi:MAG TPA: SIMPL domain-containing protein [Sphaerochaeta sp.]|nr:SIMPL domain-containing protein [Sphaerochaeta sp.]